jgi:ATP-dependent helicase/nuclease subunit B
MLIFEIIRSNQNIQKRLENTDILRQTWVIPDLRTKLSLQQFFLDQHHYYPDEAILRASDLWKKILFRAQPHVRILSQQALLVHLKMFIKEFGNSLQLPQNSEKILLSWMQDLAPIFYHPQGEEQLNELRFQQSEQIDQWQIWWLRCRAAFSFLDSKNIVGQNWISSYLQCIENLDRFWSRDLIFDLGGQLSSLEAGHIQTLSKSNEVIILEPKAKNRSGLEYWLRPYEELSGFAQKKVDDNKFESNPTNLEKHDFPSTLSSLRWLTEAIRKDLEKDLLTSDLGIVVPDTEGVWPVLEILLRKEGIPFHRDTKSNMHGLLDAQVFFARARALSKNLSSRDFEIHNFSDEQFKERGLSVARFQSLFKNIYDENDYQRHKEAAKSLETKDIRREVLSVDEFLIACLRLWNRSDLPDWLEILIRNALSDFQIDFKLSWSDWTSYSEGLLGSQEKNFKEGVLEGIKIASLNSSHFLRVKNLYIIEASEQNLRGPVHRGLSSQSVQSIGRNLGFWLEDREQSALYFELNWLLQNPFQKISISYSHVNLIGELQTPSEAWLLFSDKIVPSVDSHNTVFDSLMLKSGEQTVPAQNLQNLPELVLSPSSFEAFVNCPFVFFSRHWLGLQRFPDIDLDLDPREKGQFIHSLFEKLLKSIQTFEINNINLDQTVDEVFQRIEGHNDPKIWSRLKQKYIQLAKRFIDFEESWAKNFPEFEKSMLEVKWSGQLHGIKIRGQIDRIDLSQKQEAIVIDYKNSKSQVKGIHQWLEANQFQMFFYILALENNWIPELKADLKAALYYVVKDFSRSTGWEDVEPVTGFYEPQGNKKQQLYKKSMLIVLNEFIEKFKSVVKRVQDGEMSPVPLDEKDCAVCEWRRACRAPHLI